jgi:hypothetical protein
LEDERRRTPRYPFIATAEIIEKQGQPGVAARVTELSLHGCFVELPNPLEKGMEATFKLYAGGKYFEAQNSTLFSAKSWLRRPISKYQSPLPARLEAMAARSRTREIRP